MERNFTISLAILTYNRPRILERTLHSYEKLGFFRFFDENIILLQGNNNKERKIAEKFNLKIFHTDKNIGIGPGNNLLIDKINSDYFIICQNDFVLLDNNDFNNEITKAVNIIKNGLINCYNLRNLKNPGYPMYSSRRLVKPEGDLSPSHYSSYLFYNFVPNPEIKHPEIFNFDNINKVYILSSKNANYTENPVLYNKKWYIENIYNLNKIGGIEAENNVQKVWENKNYKVGFGSGLFCHNDK